MDHRGGPDGTEDEGGDENDRQRNDLENFHCTSMEGGPKRELKVGLSARIVLDRPHCDGQSLGLRKLPVMRRFRERRINCLEPSIPRSESHRRLLEAIADGDAARAAEVADEIVSRNQKFVLGLYALGHSTEAAVG